MLRITMLKLKRAWSLALAHRNRGDTRFPGKFHRLMTVRMESTNSDKENQRKRKQIIDYLFSPLRTHEETRRIQSIIIADIRRLQKAVDKEKKVNSQMQSEKIIAKIFGETKSLDSRVTETKTPVKRFATTAKQTEEELAQKVEVIDETPLVEAQKPKIEGFNTPPRVLGHDIQYSRTFDFGGETAAIRKVRRKFKNIVRRLEKSEILSKVTPITYGVAHFSGDCSDQGGKSGDNQNEYDSIAKRHLNTPNKDIDKSIIKEMKRLGVPQGSNKSSINLKMDAFKKPRKPSAKTEIELEARKCENEPPAASDKDQKADLAKNINFKTIQKTPKPSFVSRLHEEGIRYSEQTTPSLNDSKGIKEYIVEKRPPYDAHKPILQNNEESSEKNIIEQQKPSYLNTVKSENQPPVSESQVPCDLIPWSTRHPYFKDLSISKQLKFINADKKENTSLMLSTLKSNELLNSQITDDTDTEQKQENKNLLAGEQEETDNQRLIPDQPAGSYSKVESQRIIQIKDMSDNKQIDVNLSQIPEKQNVRPSLEGNALFKTQTNPAESYSKVESQSIIQNKDMSDNKEIDINLSKIPEQQNVRSSLEGNALFKTQTNPAESYSKVESQRIIQNKDMSDNKEIDINLSQIPEQQNVRPSLEGNALFKTQTNPAESQRIIQNKYMSDNKEIDINLSQIPEQQNVRPSFERNAFFETQTNATEKNEKLEISLAESEISQKTADRPDETPVLYPEAASHRIHFKKDKLNDYKNDENYLYSGILPNKQNIRSGLLGTEPFETIDDTKQNLKEQKSPAPEQEKITNQLTTPDQTLEQHHDVTSQGMHFNKDIPYNEYKQHYAYFNQFPNEENIWSNFQPHDPSKKQTNLIEQKKNKEPHTSEQDLSSTTNQTSGGMYLNRGMPYYNNYNQDYNFAGEHPNQQNVRSISKRQSQETSITLTTDTKEQMNESLYFQQQNLSNEKKRADENPDNIFLDKNTGDPSYDQVLQLKSWMRPDQYSVQQQGQSSSENKPADENPDNIFLDQNTGDPSYDQSQQLNPWMNPYQYYQQQGQISSENKAADENPDNIILDQNTGDPSYDEVSRNPWMNEKYPYSSRAETGQVEQLQAALYTGDPNKGPTDNLQHGFSNFPQQFNPWNQYPYSQDQSMTGFPSDNQQESEPIPQPDPMNVEKRPPYDAHKPLPSQLSYYTNTPKEETEETENTGQQQWTNQTPGSLATPQQFYSSFQPFQPPPDFVQQNPYFYHSNYTYFGKFPHQQNFWGHQYTPEEQMTEMYQQTNPTTQQEPEAQNQDYRISPDQKTPTQALDRPISNKSKYEPPSAGSSASFISLPEATWRAGTSLEPRPSPREVPDEVQVDSPKTVSPLPEVDIPLPKDENIPLSEILKRVRQRSRQEYIARWTQVDPFVGKCGRKRPPCPPPQPVCPKPPPTPPPPCPPARPTCPRPCKPKCPSPCSPCRTGCPPPSPPCPTPKCPSCKCVAIYLGDVLYNIFTFIRDFGSFKFIHRTVSISPTEGGTRAIMTEEVVTQLRILGHHLFRTYGSDLGRYCWRLETLTLARGFEPWVPIPSWPLPIKQKKKPFVCPKEGCKQRPPPRYGDPCERPCYPGNPCLGFPNKYRKY